MYKLSMFNLFLDENEELIIFNTLTSGIIHLNSNYRKEFIRFMENGYSLPNELLENLIKAKILVDKSLDEIKYLNVLNTISRFQNSMLSLTIAPTLNCNFACPYCYEEGRRYNTMSKKIQDETLNFINKTMEGKNHLSITWYGGEPLLAIDIIQYFTDYFKKRKYNFNSAIVTNGFFLNKKTAERLKEYQIESIQVTIDGPESIHDQRRIQRNGGGSFQQILENISSVCNIIPIVIRVNVDKDNINKVDDLLNIFDNYNLKNKISVYLAPIENINNTYKCDNLFTDLEFAKEELRFNIRNLNRGYFSFRVPSCNHYICGAVSSSSYVIDPIGNLYKCWDDIGNKNEIIGNIIDKTENLTNFTSWLSYNFSKNDKCKTCAILPICMGGCPNRTVKLNSPKCHFLKYENEDYLRLIKKLKTTQLSSSIV